MPDIPDWRTSAACVAGHWPVRFYLFRSNQGFFVVQHEKRKACKAKGGTILSPAVDRQDHLGFFRDIRISLPFAIVRVFAAAIQDHNALTDVETT